MIKKKQKRQQHRINNLEKNYSLLHTSRCIEMKFKTSMRYTFFNAIFRQIM
jgi:hypothetical protein